MLRVMFFACVLSMIACSSPKVRSTVDSFGEPTVQASTPLYFNKEGLPLLEKQAAGKCEQAARDAHIAVSEKACPECVQVAVQARLAGTQQVIRTSPDFENSWGVFGSTSAMGVGYATTGTITASEEAGREVTLRFYRQSIQKPIREIQIRSIGAKLSYTAVAYEMCEAAFRDYPQNLSGQIYEVKLRDTDQKEE